MQRRRKIHCFGKYPSLKGRILVFFSVNEHKLPNAHYLLTQLCNYVNWLQIQEEPMAEWKLKRKLDGKREIVYTMPKDFILKQGKTVKV